MAHPGPSQYPAPGHFRGPPIDAEKYELHTQHQCYAEQKAALIRAAAKMVQDAVSLAGQAANVAQQAAEVATQATDLLGEGSSMPPIQQTFDHFPREGPSSFAPMPTQHPRQLDQPMETYQSQFSVAEVPQKKRKSRASVKNTGDGSTSHYPLAPIAPTPAPHVEPPHPPRLMDYQMQLMLLEQQNKKRKQPKDAQPTTAAADGPATYNPSPTSAPLPPSVPAATATTTTAPLQGPPPLPRITPHDERTDCQPQAPNHARADSAPGPTSRGSGGATPPAGYAPLMAGGQALDAPRPADAPQGMTDIHARLMLLENQSQERLRRGGGVE